MVTDLPPRRIESLQAGRALAALAVVAFHTDDAVVHLSLGMPSVLHAIFKWGYLGVDFFFVLSGFIIYYSNQTRETVGWRRSFAEGRITRVYLPYLPIGLALAFAYLLLPSLSFNGVRQWNWFSTLTLLPSSADPALPVAWTLQHEAIFYIGFLLFRRHLLLFCVGWAVLICAVMLFVGEVQDRGFGMLVSALNLEFLMGLLVAYVLPRVEPVTPLLWVGGMALCIGGYCLFGVPARPMIGAACAFGVLIVVTLEWRGRLRTPAWLVWLGACSYAIYLVHTPLTSLLVRTLPHALWVMLGGLLLGGVLAGIGYHLLIERPIVDVARRMLRLRRAQAL